MSMRYTEKRRKSRLRFWRVLVVIVLFAGLFVQITMLSRISGQNKRAAAARNEINALNNRIEKLERDISGYRNSDQIEELARAMGMQAPEPSQLRYISVPNLEDPNTSAQAAAEGGAEKENQ